jgi:WD40 repeat protein
MTDAAEALQHAHDLQVLHRDMKPSNLMVDTSGQCWIIDFGLAAHVGTGDSAHPSKIPLDGGLATVTGDAVLGTPAYMAPEQWDNAKVDVRADVWGLGATLYELLTLRRPFPGAGRVELETAIRTARPIRPRQIVGNVPEDLAAISIKALEKRPEARYPTAQAFADDLRRWLNREPPSVRRSVPRRFRLWSARNKGWATAIVLSLVALGVFVSFEVIRANAAERQVAAQELTRIVHGEHSSGKEKSWRNEALIAASKAVGIQPDIFKLADNTASALIGIDGRMIYEFNTVNATSIAIDAAGQRVLSGGRQSARGKRSPATLWTLVTNQRQAASLIEPGPVTFRADDGAPLQLIAARDNPPRIVLWNTETDKLDREFKLPLESGEELGPTWRDNSLLALTSDGAFAAVAIEFSTRGGKNGETARDKGLVYVWNVKSGVLVRRVEDRGPPITALAIDPDGTQLGAGRSDSQLVVWPLPNGDAQILPRADRVPVRALAFGRSPTKGQSSRAKNRLLAAGADGGNLSIWDLDRGIPQTYCHGSWYGVDAVVFSPDGMTLASAGRGPISLWDIATGRRLVAFDSADFITGLAFTADGKRLAASSVDEFGREGGLRVWDLEMGRGILELRGVTSPVANVCIAQSLDRIAALSHDWQVAVWDLKTGFLERVLEGPQGITSDNSALAFSRNGGQLVCAAGTEARLWDLTTGQMQSWKLPTGLCDSAAFDAGGKNLYLLRSEGGAGIPVCRMRNLLGPQAVKPLWEKPFFNYRTLETAICCDGTLATVHGQNGPRGQDDASRLVRVATGEVLWPISSRKPGESVNVRLDPTGKLMAVDTGRGVSCDLLELPSCRLIDRMGRFPNCLSPGAAYGGAQGDPGGFALFRRADETPVVTMGVNIRLTTMQMQFSVDGKLAAWGNIDGSVYVANIEEVRRQLANYGLNW